MKEIMAIIRLNMINQTKESLVKAGFPALTCRKVMGRGKKKVSFSMLEGMIDEASVENLRVAEELSESHRLIPKRFITLIVKEEEVKKVVDTIIETNRTGNPGDGKIFVLPVSEAYRVRTGESDIAALE